MESFGPRWQGRGISTCQRFDEILLGRIQGRFGFWQREHTACLQRNLLLGRNSVDQNNDRIDNFGLYDQALFRALSQLVKRMGPGEETNALLGTPLLPYLIRAFGHASADVRKAVSAVLLGHILRASLGPVKKASRCLLTAGVQSER